VSFLRYLEIRRGAARRITEYATFVATTASLVSVVACSSSGAADDTAPPDAPSGDSTQSVDAQAPGSEAAAGDGSPQDAAQEGTGRDTGSSADAVGEEGSTADASAPAGPTPPAAGTVGVWLTTTDMKNLVTPQTPLTLASAGPDGGTATIDVDVTQTFQTMAGFGAAMTDSAAYVLTNDMSDAQRADLMTKLFDPVAGAGFGYVRLPIGASDFTSNGSYTYDDVASGTDTSLAHFSIDHDTGYIIPRLKDALAINPALKIMATPWSPPAWMKTNNSLNGGSLQTQYYAAYAQYFVKFIQAYEAAGISIETVTPQNEPQNASSTIPSMSMTASEQADFIASALGPAFAQAGIKTKIVVYDHNWQDQFSGQAATYPQDVFSNAQASAFVSGSAFHGYSGDSTAQIAVHQASPDKDIYFTEYLAGDGEDLVYTFQDILVDKVIGASRNWSRATILWNMVLDQNDGPQNNGCTDCRGVATVDSSSGAVTFNPEYYLLAHAGKFVFPGAFRVLSNTLDNPAVTDVAFLNPNGTRTLLAMNTGTSSATFVVRTAVHQFQYSLPAGATATFVWVE
jgi:glucosylceramidase